MTFYDVLTRMKEIHEKKDADYSGEDNEFGNFFESQKVGVQAWKGAFIRLQDKYSRACSLIGGTKAKVKDEKLEDTLLDLANYAVITLCLINPIKKDSEEQPVRADEEREKFNGMDAKLSKTNDEYLEKETLKEKLKRRGETR